MLVIPHHLWLISLCLVLSTIACATGASQIDWVSCSQNVPPESVFNASGIDLTQLPSTLKCGRLGVPMDYSRPMSDCNTITLGLAMYRPANPKGVIFFCPGGSDAGAVVAWNIALNITSDFTPDFSDLLEYDLMMVDIRGTYSSNPLNASLDLLIPLFSPYPQTQLEFDAFHEASAAAIQSWIDLSSPIGIIQHVATREVVQDYERIREALGYDRINFIGASYGSYRALQYATTFPQRVGRFVLDAVAPHGLNLSEAAKDGVVAANRALLRADAYCQNDVTCPLRLGGKGSVPEAYRQILASTANISSPVQPSDLQEAIYDQLQGQPNFTQINDVLALLSSNLSAFSTLPSAPLTIEDFVGSVIECGDNPTHSTFSDFQNSFQTGEKFDTNMIGQSVLWTQQLACSAWPFDTAPLEPLPTNASMLLVTADFEASAPTEWTTLVWQQQVPNAHLVVRHGDDHVSFNLRNQTSTTIEKEYLLTGILPAFRNDSSVTVYTPGMIRDPIPDPYDVPTGFVAGDI